MGRRPAVAGAALLVLVEGVVAALGGRAPVLSIAVLTLAPGFALLSLLPARTRESASATLAAAPALGFAAASVVLITISSVGIALDGTSARIGVAAIVLAGFLLPAYRPRRSGGDGWAAVGLLIAVAVGIVLQERVIGGFPVPGNDWAKYVLYADEIRATGSLLIDNPYWLLGVPFREDPGAPSLYGAYLAMTGQGAAVVVHGIWVFAVAATLSVYALVRSLWGPAAGAIAAVLWSVLPISQDILGWHGLANVAALALLPLVLLYAAELLHGSTARLTAVGFGLLLVALFAAHRLSAALALAVLALSLAVGLLRRPARPILRQVALVACAALVLVPGVAYDLYERNRTFGGSQGHEAYLSQKITWDLVARDFTYVFSATALLAGAWLVYAWLRRRRALPEPLLAVPVLALLAVTLVLGYAWVFHFPVAYVRMVYYLPLAAVPLVALALARALPRRFALAAAAVLAAAVFSVAWGQAPNVRNLYAFANPASVRGLESLAQELRPREVVVTDRCWSFLATWLLRTRTLPALRPPDIQPKAEVRLAEMGRAVLSGDAEGRALARRLGVRFLVLDPTCRDEEREFLRPPLFATPLYASRRLVIARIDR